MDTLAAAAKADDRMGNVTTKATAVHSNLCKKYATKNILSSNLIHLPSPIVPYAAEIASINGSSTMAAVAAAQKAERADVKGRIAEFREP